MKVYVTIFLNRLGNAASRHLTRTNRADLPATLTELGGAPSRSDRGCMAEDKCSKVT